MNKQTNIPHPMSDNEVARAQRSNLMPKLIVVIGLPCVIMLAAILTGVGGSDLVAVGFVCFLVCTMGVVALAITHPPKSLSTLPAGDVAKPEADLQAVPETHAKVAR